MGMIITNTTPSLIQSLRTQRMAQIPGALENNALTELNLSLQSETENEVESPEFDEGLQKGNSIQFPIRRDDFSHSDHVSRSLSADDARRLSQTRVRFISFHFNFVYFILLFLFLFEKNLNK